jgi:chemotaxis protein histidine kinase CheA
MAIKFPTKKSASKIDAPKKINKKVEEDIEEVEEEVAEEEEDTEEEAEEAEEEDTEEVEEAEEEDTEEEADEAEDDEEEEEEEKPVKKAKPVAKKASAPVKKAVAPVKKVIAKKGIKTGSLSSFGQKTVSSKESFPFKIQVGDELLTCDVPGKKPTAQGRMTREQLISIATFALSKATDKDYTKKDVELIFKIFEGVIKQVTEDFSISFMDKQMRRVEVPERAYPALKSENATLVPTHYELHFRRVCHEEDLEKIAIKAGKDGKPLTKKDGSYIPVK